MILTIITINYNNLSGLKKTVDSVLFQSFSDYEWIVIDGGSSDGGREFLEQNASRFAFWCSEPDEGIYNAINKGISHATGEYIQFLNSGDWLCAEDTLEKVFSKKYSADVLYGDMFQVNGIRNRLIRYPKNLPLFFFLYDSLCHQACFYKRELFNNNLYDESFRIVSDWAMNIKLILEGKRYKHLNMPIVYYDNNGISSNDDKMMTERLAAYDKYMPAQLKNDVESYNRNYHFTRNRKSLRVIMDSAIRLCQLLDSFLGKIEHKRNK